MEPNSDVFQRSAEVYDVIYTQIIDYPSFAKRLVATIEERTSPVGTVLEVGCGTGLYLEQLARRYEVTGIDLSEPMLDLARRRCPQAALHRADMTGFDLGLQFDAVVCMFSTIGYAFTEDRLRAAVAAMAAHVRQGGVLVVEPWLLPEVVVDGHHAAEVYQGDDVTVARLGFTVVEDGVSVLEMHHLVATSAGVEAFTERHVMGLFTVEQHLAAFEAAGLHVEHDPEGPFGRGQYVAVKP